VARRVSNAVVVVVVVADVLMSLEFRQTLHLNFYKIETNTMTES